MSADESITLRLLSHRLATRLGITDQSRRQAVQAIFHKPGDDMLVYWLQLGLASGIATLGLVLGGPGVIFGAMLIAPLMTPFVELSMALAIGGSVLTVLPLALFGAVSVPLSEALRHVGAEIRMRSAVNRVIENDPLLSEAVTVSSRVTAEAVSVRAVIVGSPAVAPEAQPRLTSLLAAATGTLPAGAIRAR
jgi:hypothetical protein